LGSKRGNVSLDILSSVELETFSLEGKHLVGGSHSIRKREEGANRYEGKRKTVLFPNPKKKVEV
jgi:hypothetical protein